MFFFCILTKTNKEDHILHTGGRRKTQLEKKMDSRGIEPRTTPRIEFEALGASEMLREYYTTKPRARGLSCYSFDVGSDENKLYELLLSSVHI
jgi:hypothetical protein